MNVQQVDDHIEEQNWLLNEDNPEKVKGAGLRAVITAALPVLRFVKGFLFFKPKWQRAIEILIAALEGVANQNSNVENS